MPRTPRKMGTFRPWRRVFVRIYSTFKETLEKAASNSEGNLAIPRLRRFEAQIPRQSPASMRPKFQYLRVFFVWQRSYCSLIFVALSLANVTVHFFVGVV